MANTWTGYVPKRQPQQDGPANEMIYERPMPSSVLKMYSGDISDSFSVIEKLLRTFFAGNETKKTKNFLGIEKMDEFKYRCKLSPKWADQVAGSQVEHGPKKKNLEWRPRLDAYKMVRRLEWLSGGLCPAVDSEWLVNISLKVSVL